MISGILPEVRMDRPLLKQWIDEMADETLHNLGFATKNDVQEIGERLIELERRQHAVETKLDTIIEHVEDGE